MVRLSSTAITIVSILAAALRATEGMRIPLERRASPNVNSAIHGKLHKGDERFYNQRDHSFYGRVSLGSPPQDFNVLFDTGSDILWVSSTACTSLGCKGKSLYNGLLSSTYLQGHSPFSIEYGTGSGNFSDAYETFTIGNIFIRHQHFGAAFYLADFFAQQNVDGIMGLGRFNVGGTTKRANDPHNADPIVLPLQNMYAQGAISLNLFSFWMNPLPPSVANQDLGGEISFGYIDQSRYVPPIHYYPLVPESGGKDPSFWNIAIKDIKLGDTSFATTDHPASAIVDTGSTNILCPNSTLIGIATQLNGVWDPNEGLYSISCDLLESTLDFKITFGGGDDFEFVLHPKGYILAELDSSNNVPTGRCFLQLQVAPSFVSNVWILGDLFLENWYTVFDVTNTRVGFAPVIVNGISPNSIGTNNVGNTITTTSTRVVTVVAANGIVIPTTTTTVGGAFLGYDHGVVTTSSASSVLTTNSAIVTGSNLTTSSVLDTSSVLTTSSVITTSSTVAMGGAIVTSSVLTTSSVITTSSTVAMDGAIVTTSTVPASDIETTSTAVVASDIETTSTAVTTPNESGSVGDAFLEHVVSTTTSSAVATGSVSTTSSSSTVAIGGAVITVSSTSGVPTTSSVFTTSSSVLTTSSAVATGSAIAINATSTSTVVTATSGSGSVGDFLLEHNHDVVSTSSAVTTSSVVTGSALNTSSILTTTTSTVAANGITTTSSAVTTTTGLSDVINFIGHNHNDNSVSTTTSVITASVSPLYSSDHVLSVNEAHDLIEAAFNKTLAEIKSYIEKGVIGL